MVKSIETKEVYRKRPLPLNTVEALKLLTKSLNVSAAKAMAEMESLYQRGFLSYPRTETNRYNKNLNLRNIVGTLAQVSE